jgi:sulfonate transport system substrate-binding protein
MASKPNPIFPGKLSMRLFLSFFAALTLLLGFAEVAGADQKPTVIRIGYPGAGSGGRPLSSGTYITLAHQLGTLEKELQADGIKIQWTFFPGAGPQLNEALANKQLDFALLGDLPLVVGRSTGLKHKIVLAGQRLYPFYVTVPVDSSATSITDLKGKKFGVFKGTVQQLVVNRLLERYNLTERDVRLIAMDSETQRTTLATKDVDATLAAPFDLQARGVAKILFEARNDPPLFYVSTIFAEEEFEKKYPQIVQRLVTALVKVAHYQSEEKNRAEVFRIWSRDGITPYGDYLKVYEGISLRAPSSPLLDDYYRAQLQRAIDDSKRFKLIRKDVSLDGWIEPKYLEHALKELKLENYWAEFDTTGKPKRGK